MKIDGQTVMMKAVTFFTVHANVPKDAVHTQNSGSWRHTIWLHLFSTFLLLSGPWDTLIDLPNINKHWLPNYAEVCYVAQATEHWDICYWLVCKLLQ